MASITQALADIQAASAMAEINTGAAGFATAVYATAGDVECCTLTLEDPPFTRAANVLTSIGTLSDATPTGGTPTKLTIFDKDSRALVVLTVAASGADVNITDPAGTDGVISSARVFNQTSAITITHPLT